MQFQLAAQAAIQGNSDIQQLISRLNQKQQRCLKEANDKEKDECLAKRLHFETYLSQYIYQYKEKGRKMCGESIQEVEGLAQKTKAKNDCVTFYNKSLSIFEGNVRSKLRSLVDNLDFSQL